MKQITRCTVTAISLVAVMTLSGCNVKRPERVDGKVVLNGLPSPNIKGVDATIADSAKQAADAGDYKRANDIYRQLVDKDDKNKDYWQLYAESARKAGRYGAAIDGFDKVLGLDAANLDAQEGKGLAQLSKGDFSAASDTLTKVQEKDPKRWRTLNGLGILFVTRNLNDEGMAYFTEALTQSKNNVSVLNNVGLTLAIKKETADAIEALELASSLIPMENKRVKEHVDMNLALVYGVAGKLDKAEQVASRYLEGVALDNNLGFYAYLAKDDMMAKSYLNMALADSSKYYDKAWRNLSLVDKGKAPNFVPKASAVVPASPNFASSNVDPAKRMETVVPITPPAPAKAEETKAEVKPAEEAKAVPVEKVEEKEEKTEQKKEAAKAKDAPKAEVKEEVKPAPEAKAVKVENGVATSSGFLKLPEASSSTKEETIKVDGSAIKPLDFGLFKNGFGDAEKK